MSFPGDFRKLWAGRSINDNKQQEVGFKSSQIYLNQPTPRKKSPRSPQASKSNPSFIVESDSSGADRESVIPLYAAVSRV
jgi:hypothetical protein